MFVLVLRPWDDFGCHALSVSTSFLIDMVFYLYTELGVIPAGQEVF